MSDARGAAPRADGLLAGRAAVADAERARARGRGKTFVSPDIKIAQRPAKAIDRAVPGHCERDLILGLGSSAIGTLVERTTRFTMLLHLPRLEGHGSTPRIKNGPALAGHGAAAVRDAIARTIIALPEQLRRVVDLGSRGRDGQPARLKVGAGIQVYFCDPQSPLQRGTNENTSTSCRMCLSKVTPLSVISVWNCCLAYWAGFDRSSIRYLSTGTDQAALMLRIRDLREHESGTAISGSTSCSAGRVADQSQAGQPVYRNDGLSVRLKRPRRHVSAVNRERSAAASAPNTLWSTDFVSDALLDGRRLRALTVVDTYTRKALVVEVDSGIKGEQVVEAMLRVTMVREAPKFIRVDNGPEFVSKALDRWAYKNGVTLDFSRPASRLTMCSSSRSTGGFATSA